MSLPKIMQYVKRYVTRNRMTHRPRPQRHSGQKSESGRSIFVHYGEGELMIVGVA